MKHMAGAVLSALRWVQPRLSDRRFELRNREGLVATLSFRNATGTFASARSADGCWTFKRGGLWHTRATVRAEGAPADLAGFDHHTWGGGGTIRLADGRSILVRTNLWQTKIEFQIAEGHVLLRYRTDGFSLRQSDVDVLQPLESMPELPWLLLFGWYLVVMMYQDRTTYVAMVG